MADDSGSGEKTEEPTPERLRKLRKEGNLPKSQDITHAASFIAVFGVLAVTLPWVGKKIIELVKFSIQATTRVADEPMVTIVAVMSEGLKVFFMTCAPTLAIAMIMGLAGNIAQVGFLFTMKPLTPDLKKLNPVTGFKNLLNKKKLVELLKTIIKFIVICYVSYIALRDTIRDVALIIRSDLLTGVKVVGHVIWDAVVKIGGAFVLIAAFDAFYQRKRYMKDNMMSKYEVKQEYKQSEGDPQHKAERRRFHQEILNSSSMGAVKNADVVVRNPNHIAVALKYDREKATAPKVVAKGSELWAEKILELARKYGVPIVRNIPLAHALNKLDVEDEVPEELYETVAEVLNFVYKLSQEQQEKTGKKGKVKKDSAAGAKQTAQKPTK